MTRPWFLFFFEVQNSALIFCFLRPKSRPGSESRPKTNSGSGSKTPLAMILSTSATRSCAVTWTDAAWRRFAWSWSGSSSATIPVWPRETRQVSHTRSMERPESLFLDEGWGASRGVSYFMNILINLDQWEERIRDVPPFHWSKIPQKDRPSPLHFI